MRNILLVLSYDGTRFCGWQRQDKSDGGKPVCTVQGEIERVLEKIHKSKVPLQGSGRTDSGVHAYAQAANFFSPVDSIPAERYALALNSLLPSDIRISSSKEVPENFSARFSATKRTYRYFIIPQHKASAAQMPYVWDIAHSPDIDTLNGMASCLKGETDCAVFAASGDKSHSTCRYIEDAHFFYEDLFPDSRALVFEITANAFLWKMVRSVVGSLIQFEKSGKDARYFKSVIESRERKNSGPTAPPQGLFLWNVCFDGIRHDGTN